MNLLVDGIALVLILLFMLIGLRQGLLRSVVVLCGLGMAFLAAKIVGPRITQWLTGATGSVPLATAIAFGGTFVIAILLIAFVARRVLSQSSKGAFGPLNRLTGAIFGAAEGLIVAACILWIGVQLYPQIRERVTTSIVGGVMWGAGSGVAQRFLPL